MRRKIRGFWTADSPLNPASHAYSTIQFQRLHEQLDAHDEPCRPDESARNS
jgi:hypothetical protein